MAFVNDFLKSLAIPIGDLAKWLEEEHQVPVSDTIEKWNEITGMQVVVNNNGTTCEEVEEQTVNVGKKIQVNNLIPTACQHVFIAGNRKGQQCTTKPKGGNDRCSAHKIKVKKGGQSNSEDESVSQVKTTKKSPIKTKSKKVVKTDSESETTKKNPTKSIFDPLDEEESKTIVPVTKPKIPFSDSESDYEDEKPTLKKKLPKKLPKKIPPKETDSDSD